MQNKKEVDIRGATLLRVTCFDGQMRMGMMT